MLRLPFLSENRIRAQFGIREFPYTVGSWPKLRSAPQFQMSDKQQVLSVGRPTGNRFGTVVENMSAVSIPRCSE